MCQSLQNSFRSSKPGSESCMYMGMSATTTSFTTAIRESIVFNTTERKTYSFCATLTMTSTKEITSQSDRDFIQTVALPKSVPPECNRNRRWIESGNPIALERRRSACLRFELISESLHGEDKFWLFRIFFQFLTQAGHVHVHGACVHVRAVSPHLS